MVFTNGHCLINNNISILKEVVNPYYISYILNPWLRNLNTDFTLNNCLFGSVKLTKNPDLGKYKYIGYGIVFDSGSKFSFKDRRIGKNVIIFGADMSSFVHIDNKNKDILILYEGPTQRLQQRPNIPLIFLFLNAITICQFKTKDSEVKDCTMCLGNTSIDFTIIK